MTIFRELLVAALAAVAGQAAEPLKLESTIPLAGVEGRIDHMAADSSGRRLFVAALGNNTLEVVDLAAGKRVHSIAGLHEPQGVAYVANRNRVFVASGEDGKLKVFDGGSLSLIDTVNFLADADNVRYDPASHSIVVGYGAGALGVVDATTGKRTADFPLDGHPESFQLETSGPRIFVNVPTAGHVAVVDRRTHQAAKWPLSGNQANFPMALDEAEHRLFVGCRKPPRVAVFNTDTGKIVATLNCVGDTDDLFYDTALKRIYVSGGEGFLSVFQQDSNGYHPLAKIPTATGARTSLFVADLKRLYLAVPHRGGQSAEVRIYRTQP